MHSTALTVPHRGHFTRPPLTTRVAPAHTIQIELPRPARPGSSTSRRPSGSLTERTLIGSFTRCLRPALGSPGTRPPRLTDASLRTETAPCALPRTMPQVTTGRADGHYPRRPPTRLTTAAG